MYNKKHVDINEHNYAKKNIVYKDHEVKITKVKKLTSDDNIELG